MNVKFVSADVSIGDRVRLGDVRGGCRRNRQITMLTLMFSGKFAIINASLRGIRRILR